MTGNTVACDLSQVIGPVSRNPDCLRGSLVESGDVVLQAGGVGDRHSAIDNLRGSSECSCPSRRARFFGCAECASSLVHALFSTWPGVLAENRSNSDHVGSQCRRDGRNRSGIRRTSFN